MLYLAEGQSTSDTQHHGLQHSSVTVVCAAQISFLLPHSAHLVPKETPSTTNESPVHSHPNAETPGSVSHEKNNNNNNNNNDDGREKTVETKAFVIVAFIMYISIYLFAFDLRNNILSVVLATFIFFFRQNANGKQTTNNKKASQRTLFSRALLFHD